MASERHSETTVTDLLRAWRSGDEEALEELMPRIYGELRRLAQYHVHRSRPGQTLSATDLVHEAFTRLVNIEVSWQDRAHFLALSARLMRRILINRSRHKASLKRGGGQPPISLEQLPITLAEPRIAEASSDLLELDQALNQLAEIDHTKAQVVELIYFGGLTYDEVAESLSVSRATAHRHLRLAKAWLQVRLSESIGLT